MADTKLSALTQGTDSGKDLIYGTQGGNSRKFSGLPFLNVLDFGTIDRTGAVDCTSVLQTAVTAACNYGYSMTEGGCILYFPPGIYKISSPLAMTSYSSSVTLIGAGKAITVITGSVTGYIFQGGAQSGSNYHNVNEIRGFSLNNTNYAAGNGCIILRYIDGCSVIRDCQIQGFIGIDVGSNASDGGSFGSAIENCWFQGPTGATADSSFNAFPTGNVGVFFGQGTLLNCRFQNWHIAIAASEQAGCIIGCNVEVSDVGIVLGMRNDGMHTANSFKISGFQTEKVSTSIRIDSAEACTIQNAVLINDGAPNVFAAISAATWTGGATNKAFITTTNNHNIVANSGGSVVDLYLEFVGSGSGSGWLLNGNRNTCTVTGAKTFTYPLNADPGSFSGGDWSWIQQSGIQINGLCVDSTFMSIALSGIYSIGAVDLNASGAASAQNCTMICIQGGSGWIYPPSHQKTAWKFIQCWDQTSGFSTSPVNMGIKFADLPGQTSGGANAMITAYEGMEYDIVDQLGSGGSNLSTPTWGQTGAAGSGATAFHAKLRYNGTTWTVMGV